MDRVINIYHKDWNGECILLNNDVIIRKDKRDEKGNYQINYNELIIKWDKWDQDIFYTYDNISFYTYDDYIAKYEIIQLIYKDNIRTNGEYYVDNLIEPLIKKGYKIKIFDVDYYLCWGTPNDYRTYNYWLEYFTNL